MSTSYDSNSTPFEQWADEIRCRFETIASSRLQPETTSVTELNEAMRYAVLDGGKRVRALLVHAAGTLTKAPRAALELSALSIECVHGYSLVHDDLPCMDNDVLRRGKPTCHVKFGVAGAMLAADALQPLATELLCEINLPAAQRVALISELSLASGINGMCGGQSIDLTHVGLPMRLEELREMHAKKTGALILAAIRMGALCGDPNLYSKARIFLDTYGRALGLAFQVVDDILDVTETTEELGKTAGKDALHDKPTYVSMLGLDNARQLLDETRQEALQALEQLQNIEPIGQSGIRRLEEMLSYVVERKK